MVALSWNFLCCCYYYYHLKSVFLWRKTSLKPFIIDYTPVSSYEIRVVLCSTPKTPSQVKLQQGLFVCISECISWGVVCLFGCVLVCFGLHACACTRTDWLAVVCSCSAKSVCALDLFIAEELCPWCSHNKLVCRPFWLCVCVCGISWLKDLINWSSEVHVTQQNYFKLII